MHSSERSSINSDTQKETVQEGEYERISPPISTINGGDIIRSRGVV